MSNFLKLTANIPTNQKVKRAFDYAKPKLCKQNPFMNSNLNNNKDENKKNNLLNLLRAGNSANIHNNAFLYAAIKRDPHAIMGLNSQIRIA